MVWRKNAEKKDMRAFQLCLYNNSLAVETDKHAGTHRRHCRYTQSRLLSALSASLLQLLFTLTESCSRT